MKDSIETELRIKAEQEGKIPQALREIDPTYHFCPEWDEMLICSKDKEFECCLCEIQ
ncbi:MAG TPA: hypothetical protein VFO76_08955 [Candidatus Kapabacteria bacterium]|nr:hypothetical protein [Candidatus Kapabacteria bacterium]